MSVKVRCVRLGSHAGCADSWTVGSDRSLHGTLLCSVGIWLDRSMVRAYPHATMLRRDFLGHAILFASTFPSVAKSVRANQSAQSAWMEIAQHVIQSNISPGIQLVVMKAGVLTENIALGFGNLETRTTVTPHSIFRIGSLTKQITCVLLLKLQSEGKLSINDPVANYLPFLSKHAAFTIKEIAQHTAGIHEEPEAPELHGEVTQIRLAQGIAEQRQFFDFPAGTAWLYSNAGYIILGAIIETVTKQSLSSVVENYLSKKLNLSHTTYDDLAPIVLGRASGYSQTGLTKSPFKNAAVIDVIQSGAAGAMRSTALELATFHQALLFGSLLTPSERSALLAPSLLRNGKPSNTNRFSEQDRAMGDAHYGLGVHLDSSSTRDKSLIVHHSGFISGFSAYLATHIQSKTTVVCLCNVDANPQLPFRNIRRETFRDVLLLPKS